MTDKVNDISAAPAAADKNSDEPRRLITVGGLIDETRVSLCIYGDDLVPEEISQLLGSVPTHAHRKGDPIKSRNPRALKTGTRKTGAWILRVAGKAPKEPEELTMALLNQLPEDDFVWAELSARHDIRLNYGLFIDAWNRGFDLSPELTARIARLRAGMGFDIYANPEGEEQ